MPRPTTFGPFVSTALAAATFAACLAGSLAACGGTVVFEEGSAAGSGGGDGDGDGPGPTSSSVTAGPTSTASGSETCPPDTIFTCDEGETCITQDEICDGVFDCVEATDEIECGSGCTDDELECFDGQCIPLDWVCDLVADCSGGEDESPDRCRDCRSDEQPCRDGGCIPSEWVCDDENDCAQGEDEDEGTCNGFVCGYAEITTDDVEFVYCATFHCCGPLDRCVAGGFDACIDCLNEGGDECSDALTCLVDNCAR